MERNRYVIEGGAEGHNRLRVLSDVCGPATGDLLSQVGIPESATCLDLDCVGSPHINRIGTVVVTKTTRNFIPQNRRPLPAAMVAGMGRKHVGTPLLAAVIVAVLGILSLVAPARAADVAVSTTADTLDAGACTSIQIGDLPGPDGVTSLREAVCAANNEAGADTIILGAHT